MKTIGSWLANFFAECDNSDDGAKEHQLARDREAAAQKAEHRRQCEAQRRAGKRT